MRRQAWLVVGVGVLAAAGGAAAPPSPREVLGLPVGEDRVLASYSESVRYLARLAEASDRLQLVELGPTVEGRQMVAAVVSSPANLARLAELRRGWARLADPRGATPEELAALAASLPACALITAGIHATEVAGPQATLLFLHELAAAEPASELAGWLERVVLLVVPSLNPDGQEAVVAWYRKWLGTPYEGCQPPFLYHRYAGHDNNRDFVYLTQPESRALNRFVYHDWHPQLFLDLHQMGATGPRQFVPPFSDPVAPNVHPLVWWVTSHLGSLMAWRLGEEGRGGVVSGWVFDGNWIGGTRNTGWWKNVFGVLTETASAALATPVQVDDNELRAGGKGLADYRQQVNFPMPWRGGRWGLADAVAYQRTVMRSLLEFAAIHAGDVMRSTATMAATAVRRGESEAPRAYLLGAQQRDPGRAAALVALLQEAGVATSVARETITADGLSYPPGTVVIPTAQPLRQYLVEVLERQSYPEIAPAPGAEILLPYDITAWSMPLAFDVAVVRVERSLEGPLEPLPGAPPWARAVLEGSGAVGACESSQLGCFSLANRALAAGGGVCRACRSGGEAAGTFYVSGLSPAQLAELAEAEHVRLRLLPAPPSECVPLRSRAVGVFHPDFPVEDAGWLRFVLEQAGFAVTVVTRADLTAPKLSLRSPVLIFPPLDSKAIVEGPGRQAIVPPPPELRGGIGSEGAKAVQTFFESGGTVIGFGASAEWLSELLTLPVTNSLRGVTREEFYAPGAQVSLAVAGEGALTWGLPARLAVMMEGPFGFLTQPAGGELVRRVIARFPDEPLLLSGWLRGEEKLRRRAAVVELQRGSGRAVLFAFAPYFRGQTRGSFPLLYNAVLAGLASEGKEGCAGSRELAGGL